MATGSAEVGSTANRYQILAKLAVGGMAEIFLARGAGVAGVERYCVLKRILPARARDALFVQMFLDEARLAAQLQHPNIASVYDIGMLGDSYFFTMEYVHGETVRTMLSRARALGRPLPLACVLTIVAGAAAGLHHAHERQTADGLPLGIVHRDVSPSNLMVSFEGSIKLVDFGVAKAEHRVVETRPGIVKGKISYLSPEQCRGHTLDRRSDLFSLGIVMWEMLTGTQLYRRDSDLDNMMSIVSDAPPAPSALRSDVPPEIDEIVLRLLARTVTDRYQTADEVVEAIEHASMRAGTLLSTSAVSRLVRDLFGGVRPEPWRSLAGPTSARVSVQTRPVPVDVVHEPRGRVDDDLSSVLDLSGVVEIADTAPNSGRLAAPPAQPIQPIQPVRPADSMPRMSFVLEPSAPAIPSMLPAGAPASPFAAAQARSQPTPAPPTRTAHHSGPVVLPGAATGPVAAPSRPAAPVLPAIPPPAAPPARLPTPAAAVPVAQPAAASGPTVAAGGSSAPGTGAAPQAPPTPRGPAPSTHATTMPLAPSPAAPSGAAGGSGPMATTAVHAPWLPVPPSRLAAPSHAAAAAGLAGSTADVGPFGDGLASVSDQIAAQIIEPPPSLAPDAGRFQVQPLPIPPGPTSTDRQARRRRSWPLLAVVVCASAIGVGGTYLLSADSSDIAVGPRPQPHGGSGPPGPQDGSGQPGPQDGSGQPGPLGSQRADPDGSRRGAEPARAEPVDVDVSPDTSRSDLEQIDLDPTTPPKPPRPQFSFQALSGLYEQGKYSEVVTRCSGARRTPDIAGICLMAACRQQDRTQARRWLRTSPAERRVQLVANCKQVGHLDLDLPGPARPTVAPPPASVAPPAAPPPVLDCKNNPLDCR